MLFAFPSSLSRILFFAVYTRFMSPRTTSFIFKKSFQKDFSKLYSLMIVMERNWKQSENKVKTMWKQFKWKHWSISTKKKIMKGRIPLSWREMVTGFFPFKSMMMMIIILSLISVLLITPFTYTTLPTL